MLNLEDRQWKTFKIVEVLGKSYNSKAYHSKSLKQGQTARIPYITRTNLNNGICDFSIDDNYILNPANAISLGAENATYFYQPHRYIAGNKMYYYQNPNLNKYSCLFIVQCLNHSTKDCGFGYGMGLTGSRSDTRKILLPVTSEGEPDYQFMEDYMKERIEQKIDTYLDYVNRHGGGERTRPNKSK